jgi:hypothetical protein
VCTHIGVELPDEAGEIVVLEVVRQHVPREGGGVPHDEAVPGSPQEMTPSSAGSFTRSYVLDRKGGSCGPCSSASSGRGSAGAVTGGISWSRDTKVPGDASCCSGNSSSSSLGSSSIAAAAYGASGSLACAVGRARCMVAYDGRGGGAGVED